ncbi:hypothetical protein ON010_g16337 [Phytophthora cinnamomi]|nr:hypothetical protein ON010_g16337 [Phytophthora cinnamomi]
MSGSFTNLHRNAAGPQQSTMRLGVFLALFVATFIASCVGFASADGTASDNHSKRVALDKIIKRLRGSQKLGGEERAAIPVGAYWYAATGPSRISSNIVHAVEYDEPIPKWAIALIVLISLGIVSGGAYGALKSMQSLNLSKEGAVSDTTSFCSSSTLAILDETKRTCATFIMFVSVRKPTERGELLEARRTSYQRVHCEIGPSITRKLTKAVI